MAPGPASSLQLCVFDARRGQQEGHELDKILFFYPLDFPLSSQLSVVGLSEGLITFSKIFSSEYPCEFMEAEKRIHVFHECEPDIWIILILEKNGDAEQLVRESAYHNLLKQMYSILKLFHGPMRAQLQRDPFAGDLRSCLYTFIPEFIGDIISGKSLSLPTISDSLTEHGTTRVLSVESEVLLETQSLLGFLESWMSSLHSLVLFHNYLTSSTLSPSDTTALYSYAVLRMIPAAVSQSFAQGSKRSYTRSSVLNTVVATFVSDYKRNSSSAQAGASSLPEKAVCQPLQQDAWWQDADGFLATNAWGGDGSGVVTPSVWIQESEEKFHLCAYQHRALTLLMLVPASSGNEAVTLLRKQILEKAADRIQKLEEKLTKQWGGNNSLHVPGYRYLHHDLNRRAVKASPSNKVATLAKESLSVMNKVRGEVDAEKKRLEMSGGDSPRDSEVCLRAKNNAWVSARARSGQELYIVLEKASDTLLLASDALEKFNRRHCEGRLASD